MSNPVEVLDSDHSPERMGSATPTSTEAGAQELPVQFLVPSPLVSAETPLHVN